MEVCSGFAEWRKRVGFVCSRDELLSVLDDLKNNVEIEDKKPDVLALRSVGYQMMMSINDRACIEKVREKQNFNLCDYAQILAHPTTRISVDYISLSLDSLSDYTHFSLEAYAGLYSNWVYYGSASFTPDELQSFAPFAKPASGGGPKPTFVYLARERLYTLATITGGVEASTKLAFDLTKEGKIVYVLSGRHGANMLGQYVTEEARVDPETLEEDLYLKSDLPSFQVNMAQYVKDGRVVVQSLGDLAGEQQRARILDILGADDRHVVVLNWCVSLLSINEFTVRSLLADPVATSEAYFGSLKTVNEKWNRYLDSS
jgi:hypothetical protein